MGDKWNEEMVYDLTRGFPVSELDNFVHDLSESLGMNEDENKKFKSKMRPLKYVVGGGSKESQLLTLNFDVDDFHSVYGFVVAIKDEKELLSVAYAIHKLEFTV